MDPRTPSRRSYLMSRVRSKNTEPEMVTRRIAHALGLRYRLHRIDLPGIWPSRAGRNLGRLGFRDLARERFPIRRFINAGGQFANH